MPSADHAIAGIGSWLAALGHSWHSGVGSHHSSKAGLAAFGPVRRIFGGAKSRDPLSLYIASMRSSRALVLAIVTVAMNVVPMPSSSAGSSLPGMCELDASAVQTVLGVSEPAKYAGPELMTGGTCSWRTTDPNCFLRVLSLRRYVSDNDLVTLKKIRAQAKPFDRAPSGFGTTAFFVHSDLGPGAAIDIERLYMPRGVGSWVEVTLSGRLGADGSRGLLITAAKAVPR